MAGLEVQVNAGTVFIHVPDSGNQGESTPCKRPRKPPGQAEPLRLLEESHGTQQAWGTEKRAQTQAHGDVEAPADLTLLFSVLQ